jgi:hypothetical protein
MSSLENKAINETYEGLIKTIDNEALGSVKKQLTDGVGNNLNIEVSTSEIAFSGDIDFTDATVIGLVLPDGPQGFQGAVGPQGFQGATGSQGRQGPIGLTGNQGATGAQGNQGPAGSNGSVGAQGFQGPAGSNGSVGAQGFQGPIGAQGSTGAQGNQGPAGSNGLTGAQGFQGPIGNQGLTGAQGSTGAQGFQGPIGNQGATGAQGLQGATGAQGNQGPAGSNGNQGNQGPVGAQGFQGFQGPAGNDGSTGAQGNQGPAGLNGEAGNQGFQGPVGAQGFQGPTGPMGAGVAGNSDLGVLYLKNNTTPTVITVTNDRYIVAGTYQTGALTNFEFSTDTLKYKGLGGWFHIIATFNFIGGTQDIYGFYIARNTDQASALNPTNDRISESEVYINASTTANQPVAGAIQTVVYLNTNDRVYFITQNRTTDNDVTVEFLKFTVTTLTAEKGAQGFQGPAGNDGLTGAQGFQGPAGNDGSVGAQGFQGPAGSNGLTGAQGFQGPVGAQGFQGPAGSAEGGIVSCGPNTILCIWSGCIDEYNAIGPTYSATTLYFIEDECPPAPTATPTPTPTATPTPTPTPAPSWYTLTACEVGGPQYDTQIVPLVASQRYYIPLEDKYWIWDNNAATINAENPLNASLQIVSGQSGCP